MMEFAETLINTPITLIKLQSIEPTPTKGVYKIYDEGKSEGCGSIIVYKGNVWGQICLNKRTVMFNYSIGDDKANDLPSGETIEQTCKRIKLEVLKQIIKLKDDEIEKLQTPKLKPCPLCGGEAQMEVNSDIKNYIVKCTKCPVDFGRTWWYNKKTAIEAWNRRANDR